MCTCVHMLKASDFSIFLNSSSRQQGFPLRVTLENLIFSPKQPDCPRDCHKYLMNNLPTQIQRFTLCRIDSATIHYSEIAHILESNCVTRAPLLYFIRSWVALSFKCEWVRPSGMRDTLPNHHFLQYIKAWMSSSDPVSSIHNCYRLIVSYTDPVHAQLHHLVTHSWANWI